jgi:hypothetical protein
MDLQDVQYDYGCNNEYAASNMINDLVTSWEAIGISKRWLCIMQFSGITR